jgi:O-antigen ligase
LPIRFLAYVVAVLVPIGIAVVLVHVPFKKMSQLTEGRWDLWYVALKKFSDRPVFGFGYDSWHDDLASLLPGAYSLTNYMKKTIIGGYHNEYLALLAEQGLVGFLAAMSLIYFLFKSCWKSAFRSWQTWHCGQCALFACIFLLLRAGLEIPGLFGDGSEPADFLAYIFVAIVVSRFSIEEDFLKASAATPQLEFPLARVAHAGLLR